MRRWSQSPVCIGVFLAILQCSNAWTQINPLPAADPGGQSRVSLGIAYAITPPCSTARPSGADGVLVTRVRPLSNAERAGLKMGDVVIKAGSVDIRESNDLMRAVAMMHVGDHVVIVVRRDGKELALQVELAAQTSAPPVQATEPGHRDPIQTGPIPCVPGQSVKDPRLRDELLIMAHADQVPRQPGHVNADAMRSVDARNLARLKEIIREYGFPTISLVGSDGAYAAWLLVQHADADRAFQRSVLANMELLVKAGEASAANAAYLYDRTHVPQRYGTQGRCVARDTWAPLDIEDPEHVDQRRAEVGLPPLAEYIASMKNIEGFCPENLEMK